MDWSIAVQKITPFVVRIRTQYKLGTGFMFWVIMGTPYLMLKWIDRVPQISSAISQPFSDIISTNG